MNQNTPIKKICYVATIPAVVHSFLRVHIQAAAKEYDVTVICNETDKHLLNGLNAHIILLPITRKPSPWNDALSVLQLFKLFRRERFDIVHSIMPKTGMLAMLAAWLARVPVRIHTFTGQVWVTKSGIKRKLLKGFDKLIGYFSTSSFADSPSQRDFLINEGVIPPKKIRVIGAGSICGINPERFHPDAKAKEAIRQELGISQDSRIILYVGRLNRDKGLFDLANAFNTIAKEHPDTVLVLVGAQEDVFFEEIQKICADYQDRLRYVSFTPFPEKYMASADLFCLPSYREGFGMTVIEAAACGLPTVGSRIYGITDAIKDGETGLLFTARCTDELIQALSLLLINQSLLEHMSKLAQTRTLDLFTSQIITEAMLTTYKNLLIYKEKNPHE